ncbi:MAG: hypothetical protein PUG85_01480 [Oscillospiraceae bacterium]|nr:hypothetical protein [Oscillospiraceae bacterium]
MLKGWQEALLKEKKSSMELEGLILHLHRGRNNSRSGIFSRRAAEIYTISPKKELKIWIDIYLTKRKKGDIIIKLSHERAKRLRKQARESKT